MKVFIILCLSLILTSTMVQSKQHQNEEVMKIEIWSDVVCPWCYIGKRRLESALEEFEHRNEVSIEWKSYQLDPEMETDTNLSIYDYLSKRKGIPYDQALAMGQNVSEVALEVELNYNLDKTIPVNTLLSHEVLHFAKDYNLQTETKECLLKAYFIEGKNLDDRSILINLAQEVGLDTKKLNEALENGSYTSAVQEDIKLGREFGLSGVPFFVFNRKYGISGAQTKEIFLKTLNEAYNDWVKQNPKIKLEVMDGKTCQPGGTCD